MENTLSSSSRVRRPPPPSHLPPRRVDEADGPERQQHQQQEQQNPLQFLPVNQAASPPQSKYRRAYQSCEPCRRRKSRCVPNEPGQRRPCKRCVANGFSCDFQSTRSNRRDTATSSAGSGTPLPTSFEAAMEPTSGLDQQRSASPVRVDQDTGPAQLLGPVPSPPAAEAVASSSISAGGTGDASSPSRSTPTARSRIISAHLHDTADALDLLTFTAAGERDRNSQCEGSKTDNDIRLDRYHHYKHGHSRSIGNRFEPSVASVQLLESPGNKAGWRERASVNWDRFVLIKRRIVTKSEVIEYLDFYFDTLWVLRPVVPAFYRDRDHYSLLPAREPVLLTALVMLSSRYHPLSGAHGEIRSERIHWQAWKCLQKYLQSAIWGSPNTRSLGAIAAMLLLIEWHSKSINNPLTFSEDDDYGAFGVEEPGLRSWEPRTGAGTSLTGRQRYEMATLLENLNIVAPAYRSNKMSWMLLSSAIALAQEACCFDYESQGTTAAASEHETLRRQWNQLICIFIYLADEHLAMRLGLGPLLPEKPGDAVRNRFSTTFASLLPDSAVWESYYDLCNETRKARTLLQTLKIKGWPNAVDLDIIPQLGHINRALGRWKRQHACITPSKSKLLSACLDLEYHYCLLYTSAPASHVLHNNSAASLDDQEMAALSDLSNMADEASHQMLSIVIQDLAPSQLTRYLPVRCWLFIVAANLHILKKTLAANPHASDSDENVCLLRASISAIRHGSPDDTHMAIRYARFLETLLNASLHSSTRAESPLARNPGAADAASANYDDDDGASGAPGHHQPATNAATIDGDAAWSSGIDWDSSVTLTSTVDSLASLHFPVGPGNHPGDLFQWWDNFFLN